MPAVLTAATAFLLLALVVFPTSTHAIRYSASSIQFDGAVPEKLVGKFSFAPGASEIAGTITFDGAVNGLDQKALHVYLYIDENWPEAERQLTCTDRLPMSRIQVRQLAACSVLAPSRACALSLSLCLESHLLLLPDQGRVWPRLQGRLRQRQGGVQVSTGTFADDQDALLVHHDRGLHARVG